MKTIIAYTDGSAVVSGENKGKGGLGVYFPDHYGTPKGIHVGFKNTKTGRVEIMALLEAIKSFDISTKELTTLKVYSDSQYVVKSFTEKRLEKWISNGWKNTTGNVKNRDLWETLLNEIDIRKHFLTLDIEWIKAHQIEKEKDAKLKRELKKNPHIIGNAMADKLADKWRIGEKLKKDL